MDGEEERGSLVLGYSAMGNNRTHSSTSFLLLEFSTTTTIAVLGDTHK